MARVLITGVAGFIGSNLARALLAENATVRGIDNLATGRLENLAEIRSHVEFLQEDITDTTAIEPACRGVEYVFHQAALGSVPRSLADPLTSHAANVTGTLKVLEAARKAGVKRVIYAASSSAYGANTALPKVETMRSDPISPYAVQKFAGELYATSYSRVFGLDTVSLRYFNIFGPRQNPFSPYSAVLAKFIAQVDSGETPTIFGDGLTSRDFTYVDNAVSANLLAARCPTPLAGAVLNIAAGRRVTLLEALQTIQQVVGRDNGFHLVPERPGDVKHSLADTSLAASLIGYKTLVDFRQGVEKTIDWYRETSHSVTP